MGAGWVCWTHLSSQRYSVAGDKQSVVHPYPSMSLQHTHNRVALGVVCITLKEKYVEVGQVEKQFAEGQAAGGSGSANNQAKHRALRGWIDRMLR